MNRRVRLAFRAHLGHERVTVLLQVCTFRALLLSRPRPMFVRKRLSRYEDASIGGQLRAEIAVEGTHRGKREGADVAGEKDPAEIIETIAQSIRVSQRGARRVRAHRFKELFGYQVLNSQRRERIERLMAEAGIEVRPSLKDAGRAGEPVRAPPQGFLAGRRASCQPRFGNQWAGGPSSTG